MAGFLYFAPGRKTVGLEAARQMGLGHAFDAGPAQIEVLASSTPSGTAGVLFADESRMDGRSVRVAAGEQNRFTDPVTGREYWTVGNQKWVQNHEHGYWIGFYTDAPPTPADLERSGAHGNWLTLGDGNEWRIQQIMDKGVHSLMPQRYRLNSKGKWITAGVSVEDQPLWDGCGRFVASCVAALEAAAGDSQSGSIEAELAFDEALGLAVTILSRNYVVNTEEVDALVLLGEQYVQELLFQAVDWEGLMRWMEGAAKKNESSDTNTPSTTDGRTGSTPDTYLSGVT